jgi:hypothetical protein
MKYNKNIEVKLDEISYSELRKTEDINSEEYIHDFQLDAAKKIVKSFTAHIEPHDEHEARNNHVVLVAKMQSGKTGTCNGVINILRKTDLDKYFNIDKYLYITGMNDNGLHKQTVERLCGDGVGQVVDATENDVCDGDKEISMKPNAKFFVQKNSDLRKNNIKLSNCLIFIDESHFGSNQSNVLTKFLELNGIDWKNDKTLKEKHIYIVSVSATPFDEIISDISDCKTIVELETSEKYIGISEYLDSECIYDAKRTDFRIDKNTGNPPIISYIQNTYLNIINNNNKGVIFIRTRDNKIKNHPLIKNNFKIVELDAKGGSIDYKIVYYDIQAMIDAMSGTQTNKPIIFFVKGAYRAGITLNSIHKDYVYMVYDHSNKPETTAQGLLGRMCGYRKDISSYKNTTFYVNKQHAEDYAEWENDFKVKKNIPTSRVWLWSDDVNTNTDSNENEEYKISTKCIGNIEIDLTTEQVERFLSADKNRSISKKDFAKNELRIINSDIDFDYFGEAYISGRERYSGSTVITKWFQNFDSDTNCPSYRNVDRTELSNKDIGKKIVHVVLDDKSKKLLVYRGMLTKKIKIKNTNKLVKPHKNTELVSV